MREQSKTACLEAEGSQKDFSKFWAAGNSPSGPLAA